MNPDGGAHLPAPGGSGAASLAGKADDGDSGLGGGDCGVGSGGSGSGDGDGVLVLLLGVVAVEGSEPGGLGGGDVGGDGGRVVAEAGGLAAGAPPRLLRSGGGMVGPVLVLELVDTENALEPPRGSSHLCRNGNGGFSDERI